MEVVDDRGRSIVEEHALKGEAAERFLSREYRMPDEDLGEEKRGPDHEGEEHVRAVGGPFFPGNKGYRPQGLE